jgi:hypothetical protein
VTSYHVTLDGQGYLLDLGSYRKRLVPAGTEGKLSELAAWGQDDWRRGVGYGRWEPGVYAEGANIDPSQGDLRVGPSLTAVHSPAGVTDLWGLIVYGASLYGFRGDGADVYATTDGTTWTNPHDSSHSGHRGSCLFNGWLLLGAATTGQVLKFDGTTWTNTWVTLTGTKVASLIAWHVNFWPTPFLFAGVNQSSGGAKLYKVDAAGGIETVGAILETEIAALAVWDGRLWIAGMTEQGSDVKGSLYVYDAAAPTRSPAPQLRPTLRRLSDLADNAITSFVEFRGELWAGSRQRGKLWTVDERGLTERMTIPQTTGIGGSFDYSLGIRSLLVHDDRLFVPVVTGSGFGVLVGQPLGPAPGVSSPVAPGPTTPTPVRTPPRPLLAPSEAGTGALAAVPALGWSTPAIGAAGQEPRGAASFLGQVYLSNKRTAGASVVRVDATANTTGQLITASFDAGRPATDKVLVRVRLRHRALAANEAVQVEYQVEDSGSWTDLGSSDTDGALGKDFGGLNASFKRLRFRVTLTLVTTTSTPVVTALIAEYRVRPSLKAAWEFDCRLEGTAALPLITLDGTPEAKTGAELADALWATAAKSTAVTLVDLDGESKTVEVVGLEERVAELSQRTGSGTRGRVRLQEV